MFGLDDRVWFVLIFGVIVMVFVLIAIAHNRPDHRRRRADTGGRHSKRPFLTRLWRRLLGS